MNIISSLIRREFQEHKVAFIWLPWSACCILIIFLLIAISSGSGKIFISGQSVSGPDQHSYSYETEGSSLGTALILRALGSLDSLSTVDKAQTFYQFHHIPRVLFQFIFIAIACYYLTNTLYDERADRSIFFWKSMPVSDWQSIQSKLICALLIVPAICFCCMVIFHLVFLTVISSLGIFHSIPVSRLWQNLQLVSGWSHTIISFLFSIIWMLPLYGWLILVSSWTTRSPMLISVLVPGITVLFESMVFQSHHLLDWMRQHLNSSAIMAIPKTGGNENTLTLLSQPALYEGILTGVLFIVAACWFRRKINDR
ncbi:MAG: hypothetical protein KUG75_11340 [Pseudomonadales bacterium]|nr:hypothetical protein [Pseudomonadales bacterium]